MKVDIYFDDVDFIGGTINFTVDCNKIVCQVHDALSDSFRWLKVNMELAMNNPNKPVEDAYYVLWYYSEGYYRLRVKG